MQKKWSSDPDFFWRRAALLGSALVMAGCALGPNYAGPPAPAGDATWQARWPHGASTLDLAQWWRQFDDPVLDALQVAAQKESATLAQAAAHIEQARAQAQAAGAAALPALNAAVGAQRGTVVVGTSMLLASQASAVAQASWELDGWGRLQREREAALARLAGRQAAWHEARVAVAAETAAQYLQFRHCQAIAALAEAESTSREQTARLTEQVRSAGLESAATAALAAASAAEAAHRLQAQEADCHLAIKGLVALTGWSEPTLRQQLQAGAGRLPRPAAFTVTTLPADLLRQRPDLAAAERELAAASADIGSAEADRYPRLVLSGSIGPLRVQAGTLAASVGTWSIGPALTVPVFDGGRRRAKVTAARATYEAAAAQYQSRARQAVREVEEALVRLDSATQREDAARRAAQGYGTTLHATDARWRAGLGSLLELEEARRQAWRADLALLAVQREQVAAWIALYRALGGGWSAES